MKCIIFDIDGTLSDVEHRKHHLPNWNKFFSEMDKDPPIAPIVWLARHHYVEWVNYEEVPVLIVSARPDEYRDVTLKWIEDNVYDGFMEMHLYMRKSGDYRQDSIVKAEILQQIIDNGYEPFLVVDDRPEVVDMWRSYGICTLQCASDEVKMKHDGKNFLTLLVGPAGAGKSTWAANCYAPHDILSTDQLRAQYGWGHSPEDLNRTWNYAHSLLKARLENHIFTVFDATNIKKKDRLKVLSKVPKGQYVQYIVLDRPIGDKIADRNWRSEELILKHDKTFRSQLDDILNGDGLPNVVVLDKRKK